MFRSILTSSILLSLVACVDGPALDLDTDADSVVDAEDNCPDVPNDEQFDADADGAGDACDLTIWMNEDAFGSVDADALSHSAIAVADIANFTDEPQSFSMWTDSDELVPEHEEGVVEPGQILTVYVNADARGLQPGAWLGAEVGVETDEDSDSTEAGAEAVLPPPPTLCNYSIKRDYVTVTDGEGGADPALELTYVTFHTYLYGVSVGSSTYSGTLKKGATAGTDYSMYSASVTSGSAVSHDWDADAREDDTLDGDDYGSGSGTLSFTCTGSGSMYGSEPIALGNASITVGVKATW